MNDNFFDLGGHSLQVVQVQAKLRESLGIDLPVIELFEFPTIRSLASHLGDGKNEVPFAQRIQERTRRQKAAAGRPRQKQFGARVKL